MTNIRKSLKTFCKLWNTKHPDSTTLNLMSARASVSAMRAYRISVYEAAMQTFQNVTPDDMVSALQNFDTGNFGAEALLRDLYQGRRVG